MTFRLQNPGRHRKKQQPGWMIRSCCPHRVIGQEKEIPTSDQKVFYSLYLALFLHRKNEDGSPSYFYIYGNGGD